MFLAFVKKEFQHVFRDLTSLLILLLMPVVMMLIFGFALSNEVKNVNIALVDYAGDPLSRLLTNRLDANPYLNIAYTCGNNSELEALFQSNKILLGILIPSGLSGDLEGDGEATIQIVANSMDPNTSNVAISYIQSIVQDFQREKWGDREIPLRLEINHRMLYNPQMESSYNFVPGVMALILMLLGTVMTAVSIVREKETGTMEVLLVSPMRPSLVIFSKTVPYLVLSFLDILIILWFATSILDMPLRGNILLLLGTSVIFILTTLSLGILISNLVASQQVAMFLSLVGFLMPALVFGGFMFPIENMPKPLQAISHIIPTRWYFEILKNIMIKGLGFFYIWKQTLILILMSLVFFALAMRNFKIRLS